MTPDNRTTRTERAVMALRAAIFEGRLTGGSRLGELALAEEFGLSRTPLREAFARLAEEGLVDRAAPAGYVVRSFTFRDAADAIELRGTLEGMAARMAAERGVDASQLRGLRQVLAGLDAAVPARPEGLRFDGYVALNAEFHRRMTALADSPVLTRELERVCRLPFAAPSAFLGVEERVPTLRRSLFVGQIHHHDLLEAIADRQGARAEAIAREHARLALRTLTYIQSEDRSLIARVPGLSLIAGAG